MQYYGSSMAIWKRLRQLKVPPKVKHIVWRALSDVLPCRSSLRGRRVLLDDYSSFCLSEVETMLHVFVQCQFARSVWLYFPQSDNKKATTIVMTLWALWVSRNLLVWKNVHRNSLQAVSMVTRFLDEWIRANVSAIVASNSNNVHSWQSPPTGFLKVNVNASIGSSTRYICRNRCGGA